MSNELLICMYGEGHPIQFIIWKIGIFLSRGDGNEFGWMTEIQMEL
jgi:hypothetical protein